MSVSVDVFPVDVLQQWKDVAEIARSVALTLGVFGAGIGLWLAWRRTKAATLISTASLKASVAALKASEAALSQAKTSLTQIENTQKSIENTSKHNALVQKTQAAEIFSKAIEQLGDDNFTVRLGGVYTLSQIANNFEDFYRPATDILNAFISDNTDKRTVKISKELAKKIKNNKKIQDIKSQLPKWSVVPQPIRIDVQAALNAYSLSRSVHKIAPLNIKGRKLRGANLLGLNLEGASFAYCDLSGVQGFGVNFKKSFLLAADFEGANLQQAKFTDAIAVGAQFIEANLKEASFNGADLTFAFFEGASIEGADFTTAIGLKQEQIDKAFGDKTTILPKGLKIRKEVKKY